MLLIFRQSTIKFIDILCTLFINLNHFLNNDDNDDDDGDGGDDDDDDDDDNDDVYL